MFRNHKYCVVESSGLLIACDDANGLPAIYMLDAGSDLKAQLLASPASVADPLLAHYRGEKITITDPAFIDFVYCHAPQVDHPAVRVLLDVRITSTVSHDDGEVQFPDVSHATLNDGELVLHYTCSDRT